MSRSNDLASLADEAAGGISKAEIGLGNVDNTSDANKPVSTAQQTALDAKAPKASPTFTGTVAGVTKAHVGLGNVDNESKATMFASPTFTGTPTVSSSSASYTPILDINNSNAGAYGGILKFTAKAGSTTYTPAQVRAYGGSGASDGRLAIETAGTERVRIDQNGRLGIGNNAPTNELTIGPASPGADVGNAIELRGSAGDSSLQRFQIYNNGASGKTEFKLGRAGNSPSTYLTIGPTDVQMGTDLDLGSGSISVKKTANTSGNYPAIEVYSSGTGDSGAGIAIQQKTSEGDTIIFADYDPYVEWGISSENNANEIHFTAGNSTSSLGSKTFTNNAGTARTAYKKMIVNLSSGKVSVGGNLAVHDVIQTGNTEDSNCIFRQIVRHTGNSSETFSIADMGMSDNNTALINISLGTDSSSRHYHTGGCLIYWYMPRGNASSIQQTIVPAFKGGNVTTFSVSNTANSLVVTKDSDLNVAVTVIGGGGMANH